MLGTSMGLVTSKNVVGGISSGDSENCDLKRDSDDLGIFAAE